jgi:glycosyltransferase involved in cell wall biosynthesis
MPVKVFESLGYGVPLVTTAGTETARFVAQEGLGWVVATEEELRNLLVYLRDDRAVVAAQRRELEAVRQRHTWHTRARTVAAILTQYRLPAAAKVGKGGGRNVWATED